MILLIATICASASMTDCQVHQIAQVKTAAACETAAEIYRQVLEPAENYRLECVHENTEKRAGAGMRTAL